MLKVILGYIVNLKPAWIVGNLVSSETYYIQCMHTVYHGVSSIFSFSYSVIFK